MSTPSSPAARRARVPSSLAARSRDRSSAHAASSRGHDHDPVVVGAHDVAGVHHDLPAEHDRHVHRAGAGLHRALARHVLRPHGEAHRTQLRRVAHAGVDDQRPHPPGHQRRGQQLAEHAVGRRRGVGHDEHVALLAHLDRGVDHQVVARVARDGDGRTGEARALLDRAEVRAGEPAPPDGLVHRGGAEHAEGVDGAAVGAFDRADDDVAGIHCFPLLLLRSGPLGPRSLHCGRSLMTRPLPGAGRRGGRWSRRSWCARPRRSPAASR